MKFISCRVVSNVVYNQKGITYLLHKGGLNVFSQGLQSRETINVFLSMLHKVNNILLVVHVY